MNKHRIPFTLAAAAFGLALITGCSSPSPASAAKPKAAKDEYVTVAPELGSHIKMRKKKSDKAEQTTGMAPVVKPDEGNTNESHILPPTAEDMQNRVAPGSK